MSYKIAVSGAASSSHAKKAEKISVSIGQAVAQAGCILVTGATSGVPYYSAQGAKKAGGTVIGFSPAATKRDHVKSYRLPLDYHDIVVYTGFDYAGRNLIMTRSADAVIVVSGRIGTLNEFTIAFEDRKIIGVLINSGGIADEISGIVSRAKRGSGNIIYDSDPVKLIKRIVIALDKQEQKLNKKNNK
ncbi:hypothetical protein CL633_04285 [bacterium]|nr:hypothetical protein [bacterium]|tara:strand:+ start:6011 stop:6574 length:564 start_codon:yes stop_codon:yes gene_type:complete